MSQLFEKRVRDLQQRDCRELLAGGMRGIERESLRISAGGGLASTLHPHGLGSALTNRFITTDYSEALLEFVTPPQRSTWEVMQFLADLHQFAYEQLDDELLWPFSMPCGLTTEAAIPLAQYGGSNVGRMKTLYRRGLGERYGRFMQVISGMHFNYSLPDAFWTAYESIGQADGPQDDLRSRAYMDMVRNVRRYDWLLLYLFGASPAVCRSFLQGQQHDLQTLDSGSAYSPWATSLRMSGLGYQNTSQAGLYVSPNSLDEYIRDLSQAVATPSPEWQAIGLKNGDEYLQLNTNILQIENEFYSSVRPKRVARSGERPTRALQRGGIEYVELRVLDVSPFDPVGINQSEIRFIEMFMIWCLLYDSPAVSEAEQETIKNNHAVVAGFGRKPGLKLHRDGNEVLLKDWSNEVLDGLEPIAAMLDCEAGGKYCEALAIQRQVVGNIELTPSARMLADLRDTGLTFAEYGLDVATRNRNYFRAQAPEHNTQRAMLCAESGDSLQRQKEVEAADSSSFDDYIERYYS